MFVAFAIAGLMTQWNSLHRQTDRDFAVAMETVSCFPGGLPSGKDLPQHLCEAPHRKPIHIWLFCIPFFLEEPFPASSRVGKLILSPEDPGPITTLFCLLTSQQRAPFTLPYISLQTDSPELRQSKLFVLWVFLSSTPAFCSWHPFDKRIVQADLLWFGGVQTGIWGYVCTQLRQIADIPPPLP